MAINKINLERDGLIVGDTQLVASGGGVYVVNNIAVGGCVYTQDLLVTGNASFSGNVTAVNFIGSGQFLTGLQRRRINTVADTAIIRPDADTTDQYNVTALAQTATIANPTGTPADGQKLIIRLKDNGTGRTLNWATSAGGYRVVGTTLTITTGGNKVIYVGCVYNAQDSFWDVIAVATQA